MKSRRNDWFYLKEWIEREQITYGFNQNLEKETPRERMTIKCINELLCMPLMVEKGKMKLQEPRMCASSIKDRTINCTTNN